MSDKKNEMAKETDVIEFVQPSEKLEKNIESSYEANQLVADNNTQAFSSQAECEALLLKLLQTDSPKGLVELRIFDPNLSIFSSKAVVEALHYFFLSSRAHRFSAVLLEDQTLRRDYHRLMNELKTFAHVCEVYILQRMRESVEDAFILADRQHLILRPNRKQFFGTFYQNHQEVAIAYDERFNELLEASEQVGIYTLGL